MARMGTGRGLEASESRQGNAVFRRKPRDTSCGGRARRGLVEPALVHEELKLGLLAAPVGPVLDGLAYHVVRPLREGCPDEVRAVEAWLLSMATSHLSHHGGRVLSGLKA